MTNPVAASPISKYYRRERVPGMIAGLALPNPTVLAAYDTFTDTDTTNLTAHTLDSGGTWSSVTGNITVVSNKAVAQSATSEVNKNVGYHDFILTCNITCGGATSAFAPGITFRGIDGTHYLYAYFSGDGNGILYKKSNTTLTTLGTFIWAADTSEHAIKITAIGDIVTIQVDSGMIWTFVVKEMSGGTFIGLRGFVSAGNKDKWDDFRVTGYTNTTRLDTFPSPLPFNTLTDNFTQADTTRLNTFGWTEDTGQWQVTSNKAGQSLTSSPTNAYVVSRDIGFSDVGLEVAITTPASGGFICGLVFRMQDKNNYIDCELNTNNGVTGTGKGFAIWYTNNSGTYVELASTHIIPAVATTYTMRVRAVGELITAELVESGLSLQCKSRIFLNATRVGLFEARNASPLTNASAYDNFKAYNG